MKKYIAYIPAILFTAFYIIAGMSGAISEVCMVLIWLACFWISGLLLHRGLFWGGIFGLFPAINMIYMSMQHTSQAINIELILGIVLFFFYLTFIICLWKEKDKTKVPAASVLKFAAKMALTIAAVYICVYFAFFSALILSAVRINNIIAGLAALALPILIFPMIWLKKRKKYLLCWAAYIVSILVALGINYGIVKYNESITIDTSPNINVHEYLPFSEDSKIVRARSEALQLTENLPRIDGAAALFPVYSAFVNAVYPDDTALHDGVFEYNNTPGGYQLLAEKREDIFIGVYPSDEQKAYAEECNTTFVYTPIGTEAFVFFVHKDNPVKSLTTEQIQGIYSGKITNWSEVGGKDEEIAAFQRNEGSGSQSMLKRFMADIPIMKAPKELVNDFMAGIIEKVSNYKSKSNSIGFSFRFYVEGIIKNPDIKMISVDGTEPTAENIKNGTYPITTPIYAVTYEEQTNKNVGKLLDWILSDEGQYIIEETGYVGIISDFKD